MLTRSNARAALLGRDSKKRCPLLAPRCRYDSAGDWPGLGPDRLELLRVRLEYSCRAEPFQMQQRMLVAMQLIQIWRDQHLIIKPVERIIKRDGMITDLDARPRKQRLQI